MGKHNILKMNHRRLCMKKKVKVIIILTIGIIILIIGIASSEPRELIDLEGGACHVVDPNKNVISEVESITNGKVFIRIDSNKNPKPDQVTIRCEKGDFEGSQILQLENKKIEREVEIISLSYYGKLNLKLIYGETCNCVAFRLDDVRDSFLNNAQIQIMKTFEKNNASLTIGIVGGQFGNDTKLINYIKENTNTDKSFLEIANHGWMHENFRNLEKEHQSLLMKKTNEKIYEILKTKTLTFIPPFNQFNEETIQAAKENGIMYLSAGKMDLPPFPLKNSTFYRFPQGAATGDTDKKTKLFYGLSHERIYLDIRKVLANSGFAVVTIHPYEFSVIKGDRHVNEVNLEMISQLELLIKKIQNEDHMIVLIQKINF